MTYIVAKNEQYYLWKHVEIRFKSPLKYNGNSQRREALFNINGISISETWSARKSIGKGAK